MITSFPTPYPDEIFHSLIARYHMYSGNLIYKHTALDLFGVPNINLNRNLPSHLGTLIDNMSNKPLNLEDLIINHTLYPYFTAFKSKKDREKVKNSMIYNNYHHSVKSGLTGTVKSEKLLQHCYKCIEEDTNKYGETYWHRIHQVPGVLVCPYHKIPLIWSSKKSFDSYYYYNFCIASSEDLLDKPVEREVNEEELDLLYRYAVEAEWILSQSKYEKVYEFPLDIKTILKSKGDFFRKNGSIKHNKLYLDFKTIFSTSFLNLMQSPIKNNENSWLRSILKRNRSHPLRHILMIMFLSDSISDFNYKLNNNPPPKEEEQCPFGLGPWPCLNPTHSKYKKDVINNVELRVIRDTKLLMGVFKCSCGFVYSRRATYPESEENYRINKISFGPLWEKKLTTLIKEGYKLQSICKKLQADQSTVKRYATLLNLEFSWKGHTLDELKKSGKYTNTKCKFEKKLSERRNLWLDLIKRDQNVTSVTNSSLYRWLLRNDREWLKKNYPKSKRCKEPKRIINWEERDKELLEEIKEIIREWKRLETSRPKKITKYSLAMQSKNPNFLTNDIDKIPLTLNYLNTVIELPEQYKLRKLEWAYEHLLVNNEPLTKTKLINKAAISNNPKTNLIVEEFLLSKRCK
ncbi:TnsD family Tn7-like transposition protein [Peribacillus frigoritolerans]|uniref:TnsD family Tn7-like transposition protein n=1 Tax=Peribacillus frigoritolerans TaxID=450367 RepID=UPI0039A0AECD